MLKEFWLRILFAGTIFSVLISIAYVLGLLD